MAEQLRVKIVQPDGRESIFWTLPGKTAQQILEMAGLDTDGSCGGLKNCGKCKVRVEGNVSPIEASEQDLLMPEEIRIGERLACCCTIQGEATIYLDLMQPEYVVKKRVLKYKSDIMNQSGIERKTIFIPGRQKETSMPLFERLQAALPGYKLELSMKILNDLHKLDRPGRPALELHVLVFEHQVVRVVEREKQPILGLALDLGTTSLFAALLDLESGEVLAMASQSNMQRIYGQDIVSRLTYVQEHGDGAEALHKILINNINAMIADMSSQIGQPAARIFKLAVVGNPVMLHLFLDLDTDGFNAAPYNGLFSSAIDISAAQSGLQLNPLARLIILPQLGGFVGADTTACLLTLQDCMNTTFLLCDIGTNGEIVVCKKGEMWASSAAAGPALEGGALSSGMRAGLGAIERFHLDGKNIACQVIGGGAAKGICGSGVIDLLAALLENNYLGEDGSFTPLAEDFFQMSEGKRGQEMVLLDHDAVVGNIPIVLNQEDIRQLQLAKGAIRTAIDILMKEAGIKASDLEYIYMAGVFGSYLDGANLIRIGLLPAVKQERVVNIGNAAAEGAIMAVLSDECVIKAISISQKIHHIELANQTNFQELFLRNLNF